MRRGTTAWCCYTQRRSPVPLETAGGIAPGHSGPCYGAVQKISCSNWKHKWHRDHTTGLPLTQPPSLSICNQPPGPKERKQVRNKLRGQLRRGEPHKAAWLLEPRICLAISYIHNRYTNLDKPPKNAAVWLWKATKRSNATYSQRTVCGQASRRSTHRRAAALPFRRGTLCLTADLYNISQNTHTPKVFLSSLVNTWDIPAGSCPRSQPDTTRTFLFHPGLLR